MNLIIIAGMPATGKSTLARGLSEAFGLPILEKDEIKEEMFDTLGYADLTEKRALDNAANAILLRCTESILKNGNSLIAVNNFPKDMSGAVQEMIDRVGANCVTVFLSGDGDVLHARYIARDRLHLRHQGHTFIDRYPPKEGDVTDNDMTREYFADRFEKCGMAEFRIDGARIDIDATYPERIDVDGLVTEIKKYWK